MALGAQEINGNLLILPDGTREVSDPAREEIIELYKKISETGDAGLPYSCAPKIKPVKLPSDLNDREKYASWHKKWIDGTYKSMLETLNVQPNFLIPFFDPVGVALRMNVPVPTIGSIGELISILAAPPAFLPGLLDIKPDQVPKFLKDLKKLIIPKPPTLDIKIPEIPSIPKGLIDLINSPNSRIKLPATSPFINVGLDDPSFPFNFPSTHAFNFQLFASLPLAFLELIKLFMSYNWMELDLNAISELSCKSIQKIIPGPSTPPTPPGYKGEPPKEKYNPTYEASTASIAIMAAKALQDSALYSTIGAGSLIIIKAPPSKKGVIESNTKGTPWKNPGSSGSTGGGGYENMSRSQDTVRTIPVPYEEDDEKAAENGLKRLHPKKGLVIVQPLRKLSYGDPLLIKMIEGLADHLVTETRYRSSPTESHHILEVGNICSWEREVFHPDRIGIYSRGHEGAHFDIAYPYRDFQGNKVTGILPDSLLYHKSAVDVTKTPFLGTPNEIAKNAQIDFKTLYEIGYYIFNIFQPELIRNSMIEKWDYSEFTNDKIPAQNLPLIETICIGPKIYEQFKDWAKANLPGGNDAFDKMNNSHVGLYRGWAPGQKFYKEPGHEDHAHIQGRRSTLKSTWINRTNGRSKRITQPANNLEEKYLVSSIKRFNGGKNYVLLDVPINGVTKTLRL